MALGAQPATAAADAPGPSATAVLFALTLRGVTNGRPFALAGLQGRPLLVNFWARWCLPCRREIPELVAVHARYRSGGLEVVGIAVEDAESREGVRDFAKAYEMNYTVLLARERGIELMQALGNARAGLPFTVVVGRKGEIVTSKLGAMDQAELEAAAAAVLKN